MAKPKQNQTWPKISVVIPAYNEATLLPLCLESLDNQDYPGEYELIVVDNGSTDRTAAIAAAYEAKVYHETKQGPVFARITGFKHATGDIIASTDADCVLPPDWLRRFALDLHQKRYAGVVAGFEFINTNNLRKRFARLVLPMALFFDRLGGGHFSGANFAVRREAYHAVGGFNPEFTTFEDVDLSTRLKQGGYKLKIDYRLKVKTSARRFDRSFLRTTMRYVLFSYFSATFLKKPYLKTLDTIREKPFDITRRTIKHPMLALLLVLLLVAGVYVSFNPRFNIYSAARVATDRKVIALTFDDGPSTPYTEEVLSILKENHVKATFFMVGENVRRNPEVARQVVADGHIVANHSDNHSLPTLVREPKTLLESVDDAQSAIVEATGKAPHFYRPPYGFRTFWGARSLTQHGYKVVTWDDMTYDYWGLPPDKITRNITRHAKPGGIIVLHDGKEAKLNFKRDNVVAALPGIIQNLRDQGYEFVTIDQLFGETAYR